MNKRKQEEEEGLSLEEVKREHDRLSILRVEMEKKRRIEMEARRNTEINDALQRWQYQLQRGAHEAQLPSDELKLVILPWGHPTREADYSASVKPVNMGSPLWNYESYCQAHSFGDPVTFYALSTEALLPSEEDVSVLIHSGVRFEIRKLQGVDLLLRIEKIVGKMRRLFEEMGNDGYVVAQYGGTGCRELPRQERGEDDFSLKACKNKHSLQRDKLKPFLRDLHEATGEALELLRLS